MFGGSRHIYELYRKRTVSEVKNMNRQNKTKMLAVLGVLSALTAVISFLPVRTLGLEITLSMVPVALAANLYGPAAGAVLGTVFGTVSFLQCFSYSPFGTVLLSINAFYTFLVCVPTRVLAGFLSGLAAKAALKKPRLSAVLGSVAAPVLNTLFFMSALCLLFYKTDYIQGFVSTLGAANPFMFVVMFVGINGLIEAVAGAAIAFPASIAVKKAVKI